MRIAHFVCCIGADGATKLAMELAIFQKKEGQNVEILILDAFYQSFIEKKNINIIKNNNINIVPLNRKPASLKGYIIAVINLIRAIKSRNYDLIHSHSTICYITTGILKKIIFAQLKQIVTIHTSKKMRKWYNRLELFSKNSEKIYCSEAAALSIEHKNDISNNSNLVVIPNGLSFPDIQIKAKEKKLLLESIDVHYNMKIMITVGGLRRVKNHLFIIDIIEELKKMDTGFNFCIIFCGHGSMEEKIKEKISFKNLHQNIKLLGSRDDIAELLDISDCFLSASLWEGLPFAVLEAFFSGIKCVLSPIQEHITISRGICNCEFPVNKSEKAYADILSHNLQGAYSKQEIKNKRKPHLKQFSIETCASRYQERYNLLLNS